MTPFQRKELERHFKIVAKKLRLDIMQVEEFPDEEFVVVYDNPNDLLGNMSVWSFRIDGKNVIGNKLN